PLERLVGDLGHGEGSPTEDRAALHRQEGHHSTAGLLGGADDVAPVLALPDVVEVLTVRAPDDRGDAVGLAATDHRSSGPVSKEDRGAAVARVGELAESLDAHDEYVGGAAGTHQVVGQGDAVAEAGAGCGDVEGGGFVGAQLVGDRGGDGRGLEQVAHGGHHDAVDVGGRQPGALDGDLRGLHRHELHRLVVVGE